MSPRIGDRVTTLVKGPLGCRPCVVIHKAKGGRYLVGLESDPSTAMMLQGQELYPVEAVETLDKIRVLRAAGLHASADALCARHFKGKTP